METGPGARSTSGTETASTSEGSADEPVDEPTEETKLAALAFLGEIRSPFAADIALAFGVWDPSDAVRDASVDLAHSRWSWTGHALFQAQRFITDGAPSVQHMAQAYSILRRSLDPFAREFAVLRLSDETVSSSERLYAARSLQHVDDPALVPFLVSQLADEPSADVRDELAVALRRLSNHSFGLDWNAASQKQRIETAAKWNTWWETHRELDRSVWLTLGFERAGLSLQADEATLADGDALIEALVSDLDHIRYNANRQLREMTGRWSPLEETDGRRLQERWTGWWDKNRARLLADS